MTNTAFHAINGSDFINIKIHTMVTAKQSFWRDMNRCINPAGECAKGSGGICFSSTQCEHQYAGEIEKKELQAAWNKLRESLSVLDKETLEKIEPILKNAIFGK